MRYSTVERLPRSAARCSGVCPYESADVYGRPRWLSSPTMSRLPLYAAQWNDESWCSSRIETFAPTCDARDDRKRRGSSGARARSRQSAGRENRERGNVRFLPARESARLDQVRGRVGLAVLRRDEQRGAALRVARVHVGAAVDELAHHAQVAFGRRPVEREHRDLVGGRDVERRARVEQRAEDLDVADLRGPVRDRVPALVDLVQSLGARGVALFEQLGHGRAEAHLHRRAQLHLGRGRPRRRRLLAPVRARLVHHNSWPRRHELRRAGSQPTLDARIRYFACTQDGLEEVTAAGHDAAAAATAMLRVPSRCGVARARAGPCCADELCRSAARGPTARERGGWRRQRARNSLAQAADSRRGQPRPSSCGQRDQRA